MTWPMFSGKAFISDFLSIKLSTVSKQSPPIHFQMQQDINKSLAFKISDVKKKYKSKDLEKNGKIISGNRIYKVKVQHDHRLAKTA